MALCSIVASAGFVFRTRSLREEPPWWRNSIWLMSCVISLLLTVLYMLLSIGGAASTQVARALPYYFYILSLLLPPFWLFVGEMIKKVDRRHEKRACMLRRLQFETRLGMWSPKENK
jgi:amino acid transporter